MNVADYQKKVLEMLSEVEFNSTDDAFDVRSMALSMLLQQDDMLMKMVGEDDMAPDSPLASTVLKMYRGAMWLTHSYMPEMGTWPEFLLSLNNLIIRKAQSPDSGMDVDLAMRGLSGLLAAFAVNAVIREWHPDMPLDKLTANARAIDAAITSVLVTELQKHDKESGMRN